MVLILVIVAPDAAIPCAVMKQIPRSSRGMTLEQFVIAVLDPRCLRSKLGQQFLFYNFPFPERSFTVCEKFWSFRLA